MKVDISFKIVLFLRKSLLIHVNLSGEINEKF